MKKLFVCAAALGLFAFLPASAQNNDHRGDKHNAASEAGRPAPSAARQNDKGHAAVPQNGRTMSGGTQAKPAAVHRDMNKGPAAQPARTRDANHQNTPMAKTQANRLFSAPGNAHQNPPARATANKERNNSGWSGNAAEHRPDINSMRQNMQATRKFHGGNYRAPQGYQYRHWSYGERLPRGYFARDYWISDFLMYGLFAPPSNLVWVRVGDDALLIDQENGDIVQVRYGVFY
jgi:Ni/Co efflux regulator RcnB